jgi:hypothetical protein
VVPRHLLSETERDAPCVAAPLAGRKHKL